MHCICNTVDREIFAFKYFRVINVRVSNFRHKVQEVKIIHGVFYFCVLNFRRPRERRKFFNSEYFPIYGTHTSCTVQYVITSVSLKTSPYVLYSWEYLQSAAL